MAFVVDEHEVCGRVVGDVDIRPAVVVEIGKSGRAAEPKLLPLNSTRIYDIQVVDPAADVPRLKQEYASAANDLVNLHVRYTPGNDNLEDILRELDGLFPRWYARDWSESGKLGPTLVPGEPEREKSFADTVRDYLKTELILHEDAETAAILERAETLLSET